MPELPEVQTVVNTLRPRLLGRTIQRVTLNCTDIVQPPDADLARALTGRTIKSIDRRGKRIIFTLDSAEQFYVHLGMSGQLTAVQAKDAPFAPHTHLVIDFPSGVQLRFRDPRRFGGVWWVGDAGDIAGDMGPEPLAIRPAQLARRLARTRRAIKTALLDQRLLAGVGNIYADEALFTARIDPLTPANTLAAAQVSRLCRSIKLVLHRALKHGGSSLRDFVDANGSSGRYQNRLQVYGRESKPCRRCRTPIVRQVLGGRSTHFCPRCQPADKKRSAGKRSA